MTAYAVGHLTVAHPHGDVFEYIERIQATMDPFGGRFLVHATEHEVLEGDWPGHLVVIGFPDLERAHAWYASPAYQAIIPLRTRHVEGSVIVVDGVPEGYDPVRTAARMRAEAAQGAAGA